MKFADYEQEKRHWVSRIGDKFFPDTFNIAFSALNQYDILFGTLLHQSTDSEDLVRRIQNEKGLARINLLSIFRMYVSPNTTTEMMKVRKNFEENIATFKQWFRDLAEVKKAYDSRPHPDPVLLGLLGNYKDRGKQGYGLAAAFFDWFSSCFGEDDYSIEGPRIGSYDVHLNKRLIDFPRDIPADIFIAKKQGDVPLVAGFARYDTDRGGSQEDDRTGGNHDKIESILSYANDKKVPLKVFFLADGPGMTLGSMWRDYAKLESPDHDRVLVCTLKMLDTRFTKDWLES